MNSPQPPRKLILKPIPVSGLRRADACLAAWRPLALALACLLPPAAGCAGWNYSNPMNIPEDVHVQKEDRRAEIVKTFELKRGIALLNAAQTRLRQGDDTGAREAVNQLLKLAPENLAGHLLKAELHLLHYELEEARREVAFVLEKEPQNVQALHSMGLIEEALGHTEQSAELFGKVAELAPENPLLTIDYESMIDPRYSQAGEKPENEGSFEAEAREGLSPGEPGSGQQVKILALDRAACSPRTVAILRRAMAAMTAGESDSAIVQIRQALDLEPENSRLLYRVALEALRSNHPEIASAIMEPALEQLPPTSELYRLYGLSLYRQQQFRPAEIALRKAVSLDNRDALAYFLLGRALARLGQSDRSQEFLTEACRLDASLSVRTQTR
jgi:tetratricopeptide (TPR) repeat protein